MKVEYIPGKIFEGTPARVSGRNHEKYLTKFLGICSKEASKKFIKEFYWRINEGKRAIPESLDYFVK